VLRFCLLFFFNGPRHSGSNVGNKYITLYTQSRQAGGGRERIVRGKQSRLFHGLLKSTFFLEKSTSSFFTVRNLAVETEETFWKKSVVLLKSRDIRWLKTTQLPAGSTSPSQRSVLCSPERQRPRPQSRPDGAFKRHRMPRCPVCSEHECSVKRIYQVSTNDVFKYLSQIQMLLKRSWFLFFFLSFLKWLYQGCDDGVALTKASTSSSTRSSVELATSFKCPLRGPSVNVEARLHPRENVAHLRFAAARRQIVYLPHG